MADSMIERVERAIYAKLAENPKVGGTTIDGHNFDLSAIARAAIEAMREPTGHMKTAGMRNIATTHAATYGQGCASHEDAEGAWSAMIDAALSKERTEA